MASEGNDIWPILKPMPLPKTAEYEYALWFVYSDIAGADDASANDNAKETKRSKVKSWFKDNLPSTSGGDGDLLVVPVMMNQDDLDNYFATDEKSGEYLAGVKEPPGGREAWFKDRYKPDHKPRKIREVSGFQAKAPGMHPLSGGIGVVGMSAGMGGGGM